MANPTKTMKIAGLDINPAEFDSKANSNFTAWMDHQGLKGQQRQDALSVYNDTMRGILSGEYTLNENGQIDGIISTGPRYYKASNGNARTFGYNSKDIAFSPEESVRTYLYGVATHMKPKTTETATTTTTKKSWNKNTSLSEYIQNDIFGEGNAPSAEQINTWTDDVEGVYSGTGARSTEKRKAYLNARISAYMDALKNGEYDISDEDRDAELARMQELISDTTPEYRRNAIAPWMSHLLFTDPKYYASDDERKKAEQDAASEARIKQVQDYQNGVEGATNPYEQGTEEYNKVEEAKLSKEDTAFANAFNAKTWNFKPSDTDRIYSTEINESIPDEAYIRFNPTELQKNLDNAFSIPTNDQGKDVNNFLLPTLGEWFHSAKHGYTPISNNPVYTATNDVDFSNTVYWDWLNAQGGADAHNGFLLSFKNNARSNAAWLAKAAVDWARNKINKEGYDKYAVGDGTYIIPEMVDWDSGKSYLFSFANQRGKVAKVNIGEILKKLDKQSSLYKELLNSYRVKNGKLPLKEVPKGADGMVITDKEQAYLNSLGKTPQPYKSDRYDYSYSKDNSAEIETLKQQQLADEYQHAQELGPEAYQREVANNREVFKDFTTTDFIRIGSAAADVASAIAAFAPGYGTAGAAALGIGSTVGNLVADISDPGVSTGQVLGGLAFNAAMDVVSLLPGLNLTGTAAKLAKTLGKTVPKIVAYGMAIGMAPDMIKSIQKLGDPKAKFTAEDLRNISYGLSAISGTSRMGAAARNRKKFKGPEGKETDFGEIAYRKSDGSEGKIRVSKNEVEAITTAGKENGQEGALGKFREILKANHVSEAEADASNFLGNVSYVKQSAWKNPFNVRTKEVEFTPEVSDVSGERYRWLQGVKADNDALRASWASGNKFQRWTNKHFATNAEMAVGGARPFSSKTRVAGEDGRTNIDKQINDFESRFTAQEQEIRNTTGAIGDARNGITSKYAQDLAAAKSNYDAVMQDVKASKTQVAQAKAEVKKAQDAYNKAVQEANNENARLAPSGKSLNSKIADAQAKLDALRKAGYNKASIEKTKKANQISYESYKEAAEAVSTKGLADYTNRVAALGNEIATINADLKASGSLTSKGTLKSTASDLAKQRFAEMKKLKSDLADLTKRHKQLEVQSKNVKAKGNYDAYMDAESHLGELKAAQRELADASKYNRAITSKQAELNKQTELLTKAKDDLRQKRESLHDPSDPTKLKPEVQQKIDAYRNAVSPQINASDPKYVAAAEATLGKIAGATPGITNAKKAQFAKFMQDLKVSLQGSDMDADAVALELLGNKDFMNKMRASYKFRQGGVVKAQDGVKTTSTADPIAEKVAKAKETKVKGDASKKEEESAVTGSEVPVGTTKISGTLQETLPESTTGVHSTLYENQPTTNTTTSPIMSSSDRLLTGLELGKFLGTVGANALITNKAKEIKPAYKVPLRTEYKAFTSKPLEDEAQRIKTESNNLGAQAARGTSDQGAAFAYRLAALKSGESSAKPYILQANTDVRNSIDKAIANSNSNLTNYIDVANSNEATKVAKDNNDTMADMQLLHDNATKSTQLITAMQQGIGTSASVNYQLGLSNAITNDSEYQRAYDDYLKWDAVAKDTTKSTEEREAAALKVTQARNAAEARKKLITANYGRQYVRPVGTPFALPMRNFTLPTTQSSSFDYSNDFFDRISLKKGGKLEEYGKNLRHFSKLYFNTQKLLMQESNKKQRMMSNGYAYFQKLMMQGR